MLEVQRFAPAERSSFCANGDFVDSPRDKAVHLQIRRGLAAGTGRRDE
jgi:hypothetical protein